MPVIRIDTSALTYPWFRVPGRLFRFVDGSQPGGVPVRLDPGEYALQQTRHRASTARFAVSDDGVVEVPPGVEHLFDGSGTDTLLVLGVQVTLQALDDEAVMLPMWGGCREPVAGDARTVRMLPGVGYELRLLGRPFGMVAFDVGRDGTVRYDPRLEPPLSGRGTRVLGVETVSG